MALFGNHVISHLLHHYLFHFMFDSYHQKYLLRQQRDVVHSLGLTDQELITSTVACRLNGYCGGYGTVTALEQELPPMNLPLKVQERVKRLAARGPN